MHRPISHTPSRAPVPARSEAGGTLTTLNRPEHPFTTNGRVGTDATVSFSDSAPRVIPRELTNLLAFAVACGGRRRLRFERYEQALSPDESRRDLASPQQKLGKLCAIIYRHTSAFARPSWRGLIRVTPETGPTGRRLAMEQAYPAVRPRRAWDADLRHSSLRSR
jgi:hypothetical protein